MWVDQLQGLVQEFSVEGLLFDTVDEHKSRSLRDVRHLFDLNQHLKGACTSYGQPSCKSRHFEHSIVSLWMLELFISVLMGKDQQSKQTAKINIVTEAVVHPRQ